MILVIHLTSVFITRFNKCFSAVFKNINLNMLFVNKHAPAKRVEMFFMVKKRPTKARFRFYESGRDLDSWENLFSCKQILAFQ